MAYKVVDLHSHLFIAFVLYSKLHCQDLDSLICLGKNIIGINPSY